MCFKKKKLNQKDILKLWNKWLTEAATSDYKKFTDLLSKSINNWLNIGQLGLLAKLALQAADKELDASNLELPGDPGSKQRKKKAKEVTNVLTRLDMLKDIAILQFFLQNATSITSLPTNIIFGAYRILKLGYTGKELKEKLEALEEILKNPTQSEEGKKILDDLGKELAPSIE